MTCKTLFLGFLAFVAYTGPLASQGRLPLRGTFDERLEALEERLTLVEDRMARAEEERARKPAAAPGGLSSRSEAKLDRLEVRVIQLEGGTSNCDCNQAGQRSLLERIRSLERQVARLRSGAIR